MNIDECLKKDGAYQLIELEDMMSEFRAIVKDGKVKFQEVKLSPFKVEPLDEKRIVLMCTLHESEEWIDG